MTANDTAWPTGWRSAVWRRRSWSPPARMESTGVYWIPLFGVLEERGFEVMLVDPRRIKNVSGRKTDVLDCQWLQQLHTCGLWSGAFRPEADIRRRRSYLRQRAMPVQYASHHIQHMQQALTQALERYRFYHDQIGECDREIEAPMERFEDRSGGGSPANNGRWHSQGNAPRCDVRTRLYRMTGVDLTRIGGVDGFTALKVISEIGADLTKWPSAKHFASWLGFSPDHRITGGRVMSSKTRPNANRAAAALRLAANALHRSDSARGAFLRRKKAQPGVPKAITATAHKLARLIYSMLRFGQEYVAAGAEYCERQYQQRALRAAKRRAAQLGYQLAPLPNAEDHPTDAPLNAPAAA